MAVAVSDGVAVTVGAKVAVASGVGVAVSVGRRVSVSVGVSVGVLVSVGVGRGAIENCQVNPLRSKDSESYLLEIGMAAKFISKPGLG